MSALETAHDSARSAYSYITTGTLCAVVGGEDAGRLVIIVKCLGPVYHASSGIRIASVLTLFRSNTSTHLRTNRSAQRTLLTN